VAQKKKAGTLERRAARRQAVADEQAARQREYDERAARRRAAPPPDIVEFTCRGNSFKFDFTNSIRIPFDTTKDDPDDLGPVIAEQLRLMKEAEKKEPN